MIIRFLSPCIGILVLLSAVLPLSTAAATKCDTSAEVSINTDALDTNSQRPLLSGTAEDVTSIQLVLRKEGTSKTVFTSKVLKVKDGEWRVRVSKKLAYGTYDLEVYCPKVSRGTSLLQEELVVSGKVSEKDKKVTTTLVVGLVPLLSGGTARAGTSVPVSYLQVENTGKVAATLSGFYLKQNGSASTASIIGVTTVDDKGGSRGAVGGVEGKTPFKNGEVFAPVSAVLAPGELRLFTIKASIGRTITSDLGKQLKIDVTSLDTNANLQATLPIRGTTYTLGL